MTTVELMVV